MYFQGPAKVQLAKPKEFLAKHSKEKIIPEGTEKCINYKVNINYICKHQFLY